MSGYSPPEWGQESIARIAIQDKEGTLYFFDAILKAEHVSMNRATEHPIQTGAATTDHIYNLPDQITLDIAMSDAMECVVPDQFSGNSKSVAAFEKLTQWRKDRELLTITTRLYTYENMFIENMYTPDDAKTVYGLRCSVHFREIMLSERKEEKVSTDPQINQETNRGAVQAVSVNGQPVEYDSTIGGFRFQEEWTQR